MLAGAAFVFAPLRFAVLAIDLALALAALVDFVLTPSPRRARVTREVPERAGLSQSFARVVRVELAARFLARRAGRRLALFEEFPDSFRALTPALSAARTEGSAVGSADGSARGGDPTGGPDVVVTDADGVASATRVYRPHARGVHALGDLRLFVRGPLGLIERRARFADRQPLRVEPALVDLAHTLALAASERWHDLGLRRLRLRGGETEFESLRDYAVGDDVRRVDWKAFARRGRPMVRELELERGQELILLVDVGRRMRAVAPHVVRDGDTTLAVRWSKLDWALDAALQLAAVALSKGDRVGCAAYEERFARWVAPARGARQLARLSRALFDLLPSENESDLERALLELAARHRRRASVLVLSDLPDPLSAPRLRRALASASRRHRLVFVALDDADVRAAAEADAAVPIAAWTPPGRIDPAPIALRAAALELLAERERVTRQLAASGARILEAPPSALAAPLLAAWLEARRGRPTRPSTRSSAG